MSDSRDVLNKVLDSLKRGDTLIKDSHLRRYDYLREALPCINVSEDDKFQRTFVGLYQLRFMPKKKEYFQIMEREKNHGEHDFEALLTEFYSITGRIDVSFISKLISIINPHRAVWDSILVANLGIKCSGVNLQARVSDFYQLSEKMERLQADRKFVEIMSAFESRFGKRGYARMRVLDVSIWGLGKAA